MSAVKHNLLNDRAVSAHRTDSDRRQPRPLHSPGRYDSCADTKMDVFKRISTKQLCNIVRQLATLLQAGMPLVPALGALAEQLQNNPLAKIIKDVRKQVNEGSTLACALGKYPDVFSNLFVNMVAAGQAGGNLEEVLMRLAEMLEKRAHLADKVKAAIVYPLTMVVVAVAVIVFLLSFVVPTITQIFLEMNQVLPWPTRLLIWFSGFIKSYLVLIAIALCAALFGARVWLRTKDAKLLTDRYKLKLPLFGKLLLKLETARLTRTLGTLLASGIPILEALEIAKGVIRNSFIAGSLSSIKDSVSRGDSVANSIRKTGLFPPIVFHITATNQVNGSIEAGLMDIADMYDNEVEMTAKTLTSLLEPVVLVFMGVVVGFIVMAVLLPIFEINQAF